MNAFRSRRRLRVSGARRACTFFEEFAARNLVDAMRTDRVLFANAAELYGIGAPDRSRSPIGG